MRTVERRRHQRGREPGAGVAYIEIDHAYGPQQRSIYRLLESDEHGLSFEIPFSDGYFIPGTPLRFFILGKDELKTKHVGITRFHQAIFTEKGEKYHRIGVELRSSLRSPPRQQYTLRPPRLSRSERAALTISFTHDGRRHQFALIDLSPYSAAFYAADDDLLTLRISSVLSSARVRIGRKSLFQGTMTIVRVYSDRSGRTRIVVEPRDATIDVEAVRRYELSEAATDRTACLIRRHESFQGIDTTFKAMVADLRFFLEDLREHLNAPVFQAERREPVALLEDIFPPLSSMIDRKIVRLDEFTRRLALTEEQAQLYKQYYQKNLLPQLLAGPFNHRIYFKPKGYPGDFEMMRMLHQDRFEGSTLFGKLINKYSTMIPISRAVRRRTEFFAEIIAAALKDNPHCHIFSVASGPALEFELLLRRHPQLTAEASVTLLDQEIEALEYSQENLYRLRVRAQSRMRFKFLHQTLGNFLRATARRPATGRFDLIYASGLFDYFDDRTSRFVIGKLTSLLAPDGRIVIANLSREGHGHSVFMEFGHEWNLIYRNLADMARLVEGAPDGKHQVVREFAGGIVKVLAVEG